MKQLLWLAAIILVGGSASADAFKNLGFEDGNTNGLSGITPAPGYVTGYGNVTNLVPGWQVTYANGQAVTNVGFNAPPPNSSSGYVELAEQFVNGPAGSSGKVLSMQGGFDGNGAYQPVYLVQHGDVPANAKSLLYVASPFNVYINGSLQPLFASVPLIVQAGGPGTVGVDISQFAGQTIELRFGTSLQSYGTGGTYPGGVLDSITFSSNPIPTNWIPIPVPEPNTSLLLLLGSAIFAGARNRKRKV